MNNKQKSELRKLVRYDIPIEECNEKIMKLWKEYGEEFTYGTFRNYFKIFNRLNGTTKLNK